MYNENLQQNICSKKYENIDRANQPYLARNMIIKASEIPNIEEGVPTSLNQPVNENLPTGAAPPANNVIEKSTGYIAVGVFTALGALPVPNAVVTIYTINENGEEDALYHLITDENGRIPTVELPSFYDPTNPLESSKYYFTTYNMRIQAINYYTVNVLDIRVFPDVTTAYRIDLIPAMAGPQTSHPEQTIIIPSSPIDKSNE